MAYGYRNFHNFRRRILATLKTQRGLTLFRACPL
ncbi:MAG: hypothetical protein RR981_02860 [Oscillospiraceae bacterium]